VRATSDALRQLASLLGDSDLIARTEAVIARGSPANQALAPWRERLQGAKCCSIPAG
jgi:nitrogenase molybdenum-cofactor synthesis protein NifE